MFAPSATIVACATALPGHSALLRLSGPAARAIATRTGLDWPADWSLGIQDWALPWGACPVRLAAYPAGRSYTGYDLLEVLLPGAPDLVDLALAEFRAHGAEAAGPGAFTRQALANGRLDLQSAGAVLALSQARDADAAGRALAGLRGGLATELAPMRERLIHLRALVEAGLDFVEEEDVRAYEPAALQAVCSEAAAICGRWHRAATGQGLEAVVCLAGPANAGKSALFASLTGAHALVSQRAGTTRDWLTASWELDGRAVELIDTAGWLDDASAIDAVAIDAGRSRLDRAAVVLLCSAPDARLPETLPEGLGERAVIIATKADLGRPDPRASLAVSVTSGAGLSALTGLVQRQLRERCGGDRRQAALLAEAETSLLRLAAVLPPDELLAADLRGVSDLLGDLLGVTTDDEVLDAIFSAFCIGK